MNRLELLYGYQKTESGLKVYADMHHANQNTMTIWIRQFLLHGLARVCHRSFNHRYSLNTKIEAVKEYQAGFPGEKIIEKYDIRSLSQLKQWSIQYNNDELKTKSRKSESEKWVEKLVLKRNAKSYSGSWTMTMTTKEQQFSLM